MMEHYVRKSDQLYSSDYEIKVRDEWAKAFEECPIPSTHMLQNLGLFLNSKNLSRILFLNHIYKLILDVPGIVIEFGTRWGNCMSLFSALRGIYESYHRHRKIVGFDTFTGFPEVGTKDNEECPMMHAGGLACTENYVEYLERIMCFQEDDNPLSHIKKFEIRAGDACVEIDRYFKEYPESIVALAFFDFDIYEPTKRCLEAIKGRLVKGSVLAFDELNDHDSPGETLALDEIFGLNNIKLKRFPITTRLAYFIVE